MHTWVDMKEISFLCVLEMPSLERMICISTFMRASACTFGIHAKFQRLKEYLSIVIMIKGRERETRFALSRFYFQPKHNLAPDYFPEQGFCPQELSISNFISENESSLSSTQMLPPIESFTAFFSMPFHTM